MDFAVKATKARIDINGNTIVHNVDLKILPRKLWIVAGHNGSGKSTLMRALAGQQRLADGKIEFAPNQPPQYVAQNPDQHIVLPTATADAALSLAFQTGGKSETRETARAAVSSALQTVFQDDAETISMRDNSTLSGGQKARVALAGALAKAYTLGGGTLLLDEVNAYLDFEESNRLLAFIRELVSADTEYNFSAILVTHREEDLKFADGFTFLRRGRILKTTTDYNQALRQFAKI